MTTTVRSSATAAPAAAAAQTLNPAADLKCSVKAAWRICDAASVWGMHY